MSNRQNRMDALTAFGAVIGAQEANRLTLDGYDFDGEFDGAFGRSPGGERFGAHDFDGEFDGEFDGDFGGQDGAAAFGRRGVQFGGASRKDFFNKGYRTMKVVITARQKGHTVGHPMNPYHGGGWQEAAFDDGVEAAKAEFRARVRRA